MSIPDFTATERAIVEELLRERYGHDVALELADAELRLDPAARELTSCPTFYWTERGAHFVVFKTAEQQYRNQFFYSVNEQYGTGRAEYDDIGECVGVLLKLQADHEKERAGIKSGATAEEICSYDSGSKD